MRGTAWHCLLGTRRVYSPLFWVAYNEEWNLLVWVQEERESFGKNLEALNIVDCFRCLYPDTVGQFRLPFEPDLQLRLRAPSNRNGFHLYTAPTPEKSDRQEAWEV